MATEILRQFIANQNEIIFWFSILAIGAGLLAPISVILGRLGSSKMAVWIGVLAAAVQVIGRITHHALIQQDGEKAGSFACPSFEYCADLHGFDAYGFVCFIFFI